MTITTIEQDDPTGVKVNMWREILDTPEADKVFSMEYLEKSPTFFVLDTLVSDIRINADGTRMIVLGDNTNRLYEFELTVPWHVLTLNISDIARFFLGSQSSQPSGFDFSPDGSKLLVVDYTTTTVFQYSLPVANSIDGMSYDGLSYNTALTHAEGLRFSADGYKVFIGSSDTNIIHQYSVTTSGTLVGMTPTSSELDLSAIEDSIAGFDFNSTGLKLYVTGATTGEVHEFILTNAYDFSVTPVYSGLSLDISTEDTLPSGIIITDDPKYTYIMGVNTDYIYQYSYLYT